MKHLSFIFSLILFTFYFSSCEINDNFSSDPNLRIEFSTDTVRFDTVFTSFGSATRTLKVYNRNSNSINISSVEIMGGEKSFFRMNVDGVGGKSKIENVDLYKKDSVFIAIEVTVDPLKQDNPILVEDSIRINFNGVSQYIHLEAIGQDVNLWIGKAIEKDTILTEGKPFLIYDSLHIKKDVLLDIRKNVKLYFRNKAKVVLDGRIKAIGTLSEPVVFRGERFDRILSNVPYDRIPGQWGGIVVDSLSFNNHFEYVNIRNTEDGILFKQSNLNTKKATFINSIVHNSVRNGVFAESCWIEGRNSQFSNAGGNVVHLIGGKYTFLHCTLANYISWWGMRKDKALYISNISSNSEGFESVRPLIQCDFTNSIISGSTSTEITLNKSESVPFNHLFTNCLIRVSGQDDTGTQEIHFVNNVWKQDAKFKNTNKDKDYFYSFELDSLSPAINMANRVAAIDLPFDMKGVSRLQDDNPDIGCYEWIPTEEK